jgi:hypothetical protein
LWFAICHVRALEPRQTRLRVEKSSRPRLKRKPFLAMDPPVRRARPGLGPDVRVV